MGKDDFILDEDDASYDEDPGDEYYRRSDMCVQKIIACFEDVSRELDRHEAWQLFDQFVQATRTKFRPKKRKGAHNSDFDTALLTAYDTAPRGKKTAKTNEVGAAYRKTPDTTQKHLRRLLEARKELQRLMAAWAKQCADKTASE